MMLQKCPLVLSNDHATLDYCKRSFEERIPMSIMPGNITLFRQKWNEKSVLQSVTKLSLCVI